MSWTRGVQFPPRAMVEFLLFTTVSRPTLGPPASYPRALAPRLKRPGREADYSPPSTAKTKNEGAMPSLSNTSSLRGA